MTWLALTATILVLVAPAQAARTTVPFVGCAGAGQGGKAAAPKGEPQAVDLDPTEAKVLAFYKAVGNDGSSLSVLAPKGWHCFYRFGTSGDILLVAPVEDVAEAEGIAVTRTGVVVSAFSGATVGRFVVATYAARLFSKTRRDFVERILAEGVMRREELPYGPYPDDILTYDGPNRVIFQTPAGKVGIGNYGKISSAPIYGTATLSDDENPEIVVRRVSLPPELQRLRPAILAKRPVK